MNEYLLSPAMRRMLLSLYERGKWYRDLNHSTAYALRRRGLVENEWVEEHKDHYWRLTRAGLLVVLLLREMRRAERKYADGVTQVLEHFQDKQTPKS